MNKGIINFGILLVLGTFMACTSTTQQEQRMKDKVEQFKTVRLSTDLEWLTENDREIIRILIDVSDIMDDVFWMQAYGNKENLLQSIEGEHGRQYVSIHYGPWDRLADNAPFVDGYGEKPPGANFYPQDMTVDEFESWDEPSKQSLYTLIRRNEDGNLQALPYSEAYAPQHREAARLLRKAADIASDQGLKHYLEMRADALLSNEYQASDYAWMAMKESSIDFVVGPIENYEDRLFGYKAAHEAFVLLKDLEWSAQLEKFNAMLPMLQQELPVDEPYKAEEPGSDADMNVYYALYYAGDCNAGAKTIAINLPNDPEIHLSVGSRKLQLKNSMQAKFDHILVPIAHMLIDEEQRKHITFDAFFENTTFHEVAHGMGIKNTINGRGPVREALRAHYSAIEEAKADIMGLYLVTKLYEMGEIDSGELMDNYVTFFAGIFRSTRFGAASAHGKANMLSMNYFADQGAFIHQADGTYKINFEPMRDAVSSLLEKILVIQGDGDHQRAGQWIEKDGVMDSRLQNDLERVNKAGIPIDIVFEQGKEVLGL